MPFSAVPAQMAFLPGDYIDLLYLDKIPLLYSGEYRIIVIIGFYFIELVKKF